MKKLLAINIFGLYYEVLPINGKYINKNNITYHRIIERIGEKPKYINNCFDNIHSAKEFSINEAVRLLTSEKNNLKNNIIMFIDNYKREDIIYKLINLNKYINYKRQLMLILNNSKLYIDDINDLLLYEYLDQEINIENKYSLNSKIKIYNNEYIIKDMDAVKLHKKYEVIYTLIDKKCNELKIMESKLIKDII